MHISVTDAKARLADLVRWAEAGDEVIVTRNGQAVVRLAAARVRSMPDPKARRKLLEAVRSSAAARVAPGPDAARSQDFLYGWGSLRE